MKLAITIDVEEEGLFAGRYSRTPSGVENIMQLHRLEFISREFGLPLTLLTTYQVAQDPAACDILADWRDRHRAEIGAHLHPWNTPPFRYLPFPEPVRSGQFPRDLLRDKLATLVEAVEKGLGLKPTSFRMGRFDAGPQVFSLLPEFGIRVDSSIAPMRQEVGGPDHFLTPADPFYLRPAGPEGPALLEAPLTIVPVWTRGASWIYWLSRYLAAREKPGEVDSEGMAAGLPFPGPTLQLSSQTPSRGWGREFEGAGRGLRPLAPSRKMPFTEVSARGERLRFAFAKIGATGPQPTMFPLFSMCLAARLHRCRGGRIMVIYLHSSELLPGASPQFPTEAAVGRLLNKIKTFLAWLSRTGPVTGVTLSGLWGIEDGGS